MNCRKCRSPDANIFLGANNQQTKTPLCRDCYERQVARSFSKRDIFRHCFGTYHGPARDPYHKSLQESLKESMGYWDDLEDEE